ncbi:DUF2064 domain-containing protein [Nocardioides perillae]|uniref:Glycosyltransferase involved in cell wall biogenesis n=1 Tax=Nocardioides perillae TaxID=1119534 RepID=A0A7Y9RWN4_9ACTN|nr:hypothetical protein [Nocardioides perillae]
MSGGPGLRALVVAKAPVPGLAKTRLAAVVGDVAAADLAAAALLDTLAACEAGVGSDRLHVALTGELADAARSTELRRTLAAYDVFEQCAGGFDRRLAHAHGEVARRAPGDAVVQVGMDTPQLTAHLLTGLGEALAVHDAVLAPADDGGWWALGLRDPRAAEALVGVPMSTGETGAMTRAALERAGLSVAGAPALRDVDEVDDAAAVAAGHPHTRFARAWAATSPAGRRAEA